MNYNRRFIQNGLPKIKTDKISARNKSSMGIMIDTQNMFAAEYSNLTPTLAGQEYSNTFGDFSAKDDLT